MKTVIICVVSVLFAAVAFADIYTWEDENGEHFTDNPSSMPDKYREYSHEQSSVTVPPPVRVTVLQPERPRDITYRTDYVQHAEPPVPIKHLHHNVIPVDTVDVSDTSPSIATLFVIIFILLLFLVITWIMTIADIMKSDFATSSIKALWVVLVVFVPYFGMAAYYISGRGHKHISSNVVSFKHSVSRL